VMKQIETKTFYLAIALITEYTSTVPAKRLQVHNVTSPIATLSITVIKYTSARFAQRKTSEMLRFAFATISLHSC